MTRILPIAACVALFAGLFSALPARATTSTNFNGIVALSNCSGAVVRWSTSLPSDEALMLTNGHCYQLLGAHEVVVDVPQVRDVTLLTPDGSTAGVVQTTTLLYATMWQTDVALYDLGLTYRQLHRHFGVQAITLANKQPGKYRAISIISGYWLTEYDCNLNGFVYRLHEDVYTWRGSLRYADGGCPTIDGTSGSPVLNANRLEVGINNTGNEAGEHCTLNNPCEENRRGVVTVHEGRDYGQETWIFYTCLTGNGLDLAKVGCRLPSP